MLQVGNVGTGPHLLAFTIQGSVDGVAYVAIPYATVAAPGPRPWRRSPSPQPPPTCSGSLPNFAWRFLKLNISALTTETLTFTVFVPAA